MGGPKRRPFNAPLVPIHHLAHHRRIESQERRVVERCDVCVSQAVSLDQSCFSFLWRLGHFYIISDRLRGLKATRQGQTVGARRCRFRTLKPLDDKLASYLEQKMLIGSPTR